MKRYDRLPILSVVAMSVLCFAAMIRTPIFAQEHKPDQHTLLLLHCNGNLSGAQGEKPTQEKGVAFETGIFGNGAYFAPGNQVYFPSAGNLISTAGTLEFWIKPRWNGNDGQGYVVLTFGIWGGMLFVKEGGNLRMILNRYGPGGLPEMNTGSNISTEWLANQWHHCAFTWNSDYLKLYVDGNYYSGRPVTISLPIVNEATFQLGAEGNTSYLDAVIDELCISDIERSLAEVQASYLAGITVSSLTIQPDPLKLVELQQQSLKLTAQTNLGKKAFPAWAAKWSSANPAIATVDENGRVTGIAAGKTTITASYKGVSDSATVTVEPLPSETFTVTNTNDSGPGSLRQAILDAEATSGREVIRFNIPGSGPHTIQLLSGLPEIFDSIVIDGTTQPGFAGKPIIELDGSKAGPVTGLFIRAGSSLVQGLVINRFGGSGIELLVNGGNVIQGNFLGTDVAGAVALGNARFGMAMNSNNNLVGGTTPAARNLISGNLDQGVNINGGATGNLVQGNFIGTDVTGAARLGNGTGVDIALGSFGNTIGGDTPGARNLISGNLSNGIRLEAPAGATGNRVEGNYIGTDVTGNAALGNLNGVLVGRSNSIIKGNVISGNSGVGIFMGPSATGSKILDNFIGTNASGAKALGNLGDGIDIAEGNNNLIANNVIAFNGGGVNVYSGAGNAILSNSIFSNSGLGIDLNVDGVTLNDAGDGDTGANNLQNFPVLNPASTTGDKITIRGTLNSTPNTSFRLEFFSNPACDPSNHGEGKSFLGSMKVTTGGSGNANFEASFDTEVAPGQLITATASDPGNNTSELSQCIAVEPPPRAVVIPDTFAAPGDSIDVPIRITDASGVAGAQLAVTYNPKILTALGAQTTALTKGFLLADSVSAGKIVIAMASGASIDSGSGSFVNLTFVVNPTAALGDTTSLTFARLAFFDDRTNPISATPVNGVFTVSEIKSIQILPDSTVFFVKLGDEQVFHAQGLDVNNQPVAVSANWSVDPVGLGSFNPTKGDSTTFTAQSLGDGIVKAQLGAISKTVEITVGLLGDINKDLLVDARDAFISLRMIVGLDLPPMPPGHKTPTAYEKWAADFNEDKLINTADALLILRQSLGRLQALPKTVAGNEDAVLRLPRIEAPAGETVTAPILVGQRMDVYAAELSLSYDPTALTLLGVAPGDTMSLMAANTQELGKIKLAMINAGGLVGKNGELVQLQFKLQRAHKNESAVAMASFNLFDAQAKAVQARVETDQSNATSLPQSYNLLQNYPNPFLSDAKFHLAGNPATTIRYQLPKESSVKLQIYDLRGYVVRTLVNAKMKAGEAATIWDGKDEAGDRVPSGAYFYRLQVNGSEWTSTRKMMVIR